MSFIYVIDLKHEAKLEMNHEKEKKKSKKKKRLCISFIHQGHITMVVFVEIVDTMPLEAMN